MSISKFTWNITKSFHFSKAANLPSFQKLCNPGTSSVCLANHRFHYVFNNWLFNRAVMHFCLELIHLCLSLSTNVRWITDGIVQVLQVLLPTQGPILGIIHVRPCAQKCSGMLKPPENVIYGSRGVQGYTFSLPMRTNKSPATGPLKPEEKLSAAKLTKMNALTAH